MSQITKLFAAAVAGVSVCAVIGLLSAIPYVLAFNSLYIPLSAKDWDVFVFVGATVASVAAVSGLSLFVVIGIPLHLILVRLGKASVWLYALVGLGASLLYCAAMFLAIQVGYLTLQESDLILAVVVAILCGPLAEIAFWQIVRPDGFRFCQRELSKEC